MNEQGRNRLTGSMILASLAVIFLPMLFDGAGIERREVPRMPPAEPQAPVERLDASGEDWAFLEEARRRRQDAAGGVSGLPRHDPVPAAELEERAAQGPSLDAAGAPRAWSVQLASFSERENAERLRRTLVSDGFEAYVTAGSEADRALYRVAVGPSLDPGAVRRLRDELAARYALEGMVVRFSLAGAEAGDDGG